MTTRLLVSCDGKRAGQTCRAFWTSGQFSPLMPGPAWEAAEAAGWRFTGTQDRCPSGHHDDDPPTAPD